MTNQSVTDQLSPSDCNRVLRLALCATNEMETLIAVAEVTVSERRRSHGEEFYAGVAERAALAGKSAINRGKGLLASKEEIIEAMAAVIEAEMVS